MFSEREGIKPQKAIRIRSIDKELRNCLWNIFQRFVRGELRDENTISVSENFFYTDFYQDVLKKKLTSEYCMNKEDFIDELESCFNNDFKWYEIFNCLEFAAKQLKEVGFIEECNFILERENSAYRFISGQIVNITSETEIAEIEKAVQSPLSGVKTHLNSALSLYADRKAPDYRNSIKESISAVEAVCRIMTKENTLGDALKKLESCGLTLNPSLKLGLEKLYGYTNGKEGIRHAILDESRIEIEEEDARFFLITCSAFVNYLTVKAEKLNMIISA